jgi:hypothetical protein
VRPVAVDVINVWFGSPPVILCAFLALRALPVDAAALSLPTLFSCLLAEVRRGLNMTADEVLASIKRNDSEISPSNIFAVACEQLTALALLPRVRLLVFGALQRSWRAALTSTVRRKTRWCPASLSLPVIEASLHAFSFLACSCRFALFCREARRLHRR